jgi:hypothetical protein
MRSLRILCVGILFLNLACNDDNLDKVPNEYNQKELNISITSIEHLKNSRPKVEQNIRPLLDKINHQKKSSIELDFQIEESHVQIIEQENFTTYTFFVYRNTLTPGILENYTYKEYNDNTFEQYLLKYHYTFNQNGGIIYDTNIFEVDIIQGNSLISKSTVSCVPEFVEVLDSFICTYNERCTGSGRHEAGDNSCLCTPSPDTCDPANSTSCEYEYVWVYQGCNTGGGNIIDNNTGDNNTGGGSSTDDTDNMDNETQSLPLEDPRPIWESILNCINFSSLGQTDTTTIDPSILEQLYLTPRQWSQINEYLQNNSCSEDAQEKIIEYIEVVEEFSEARLDRFLELKDLIEDNPMILIENCAIQNGVNTTHYIDLYTHPFPQECQDRLSNSVGIMTHQPITEGNVPLANIDYYGVEITSYPDFNNDGVQDSEIQIYEAFRNNFINLASGNVNDFQFDCDLPFNSTDIGSIEWEFVPVTSQDGLDFVSENPIASILLIEADASGLGSLVADDGAIIVTGFTNNDWTISTLYTTNNGSQPFSGNRQWGWYINQNGNLELFTRAVDVATISKLLNVLSFGSTDTECQQETYYNVAEATWENMQQEMVNWVNSNGGVAAIVPKTAVRVDKEKIEELLTNNVTITEINCD